MVIIVMLTGSVYMYWSYLLFGNKMELGEKQKQSVDVYFGIFRRNVVGDCVI
jgi:hypothetical protein